MDYLSYLLAGAVVVLAAVCCLMGFELKRKAYRLTRLGYQKHIVEDERLRLANEKRRLESYTAFVRPSKSRPSHAAGFLCCPGSAQ